MYGKPSRISIRFLACVVALVGLSLSAQAAAGDPDRWLMLPTAGNGSKVVFGPSGTGTALPAQAAINASGWTKAGNFGVAPGPTGITVGSTANYPLPNGRTAAVTVSAVAKPLSVAKAIGKLVATASGLGYALSLGSAAYDLARELGFTLDNSSGVTVVTQDTASGWVWHVNNGSTILHITAGSAAAACAAAGGSYYTGGAVPWCNPWATIVEQGSAVSAGVAASTPQAFEDAIAAKTDWPAAGGTKIDEALRDAMASGQSIETEAPVVTGPATVEGPATTTTTAAQNGNPATSTTVSTVNNITYDGDRITYNTTNSSVVNNGTTTTTTTTTKEADPPEDGCTAHPERIACSQFGTPVEQVLPKSSIDVAITPVTFTTASGCPADLTMPFSVLGHSYSPAFSYASMCSTATNWVKPVVLILAFAAAAFIFVGGLKT